MNQFNTPIIFIIFNRPETAKRVFQQIKEIKPKQLLVIADGPRQTVENEQEGCEATRAIIDTIDWDCQVLKNYSSVNLGCKKRISSGLKWAFENVEEAIILEDDCLPERSFFSFCEELLERYRNNEKIMHISGQNLLMNDNLLNESYYISKYAHIWGWATWRRAFQNYDVEMSDWHKIDRKQFIGEIVYSSWYRDFVADVFNDTFLGKIDTWDYQWGYTVWKKNGYCIQPANNLVSNIGFGEDATHTKNRNIFSDQSLTPLNFPLVHPQNIKRNVELDRLDEIMYRRSLKYSFFPYRLYKLAKMIYKKILVK